ncbi:MAG TPA: DNA-3-methyladenine glycosylase [Thermoleophilaceae bacterium]|nr:DNA-3-methyladenine glycosylase [Thermoleophilaceae bacterium]
MPRPSAGSRTTPVAETAQALEHLSASDPVIAALIERYEDPDGVLARRGRPPGDAYGALLRSIVGQQVSTHAAKAIYGRILDLYGDRTPTPSEILATDAQALRDAGLSRMKVAYLGDLAQKIEDGELRLNLLGELPDEEVAAQLTQVKGLGQWTADMFLLFHLGRPDVLPVGDLGIRRAAQVEYGLEELPSAAELRQIAEPWRPCRSLACLYLWRSLDNTPA